MISLWLAKALENAPASLSAEGWPDNLCPAWQSTINSTTNTHRPPHLAAISACICVAGMMSPHFATRVHVSTCNIMAVILSHTVVLGIVERFHSKKPWCIIRKPQYLCTSWSVSTLLSHSSSGSRCPLWPFSVSHLRVKCFPHSHWAWCWVHYLAGDRGFLKGK